MIQLPEIDPGSDENGAMQVLLDTVTTAFGNVSMAIKKNMVKAFGHMMKVPNAYIDGWAAEISANSNGRVLITRATAKALAAAVEVDCSLATIATSTHASKILRQQVNVTKVMRKAAEEVQKLPAPAEAKIQDISEDWLNAFEREAVDMSSEHMQRLFGKILAGEISRPTSYSIRTVKLMAQLDNHAAQLFQKLCSLACTIEAGTAILDSRVITVADRPGENGLKNYGLGFSELNILLEYGLVISEYDSYMMYGASISDCHNSAALPFRYQSRYYVPVSKSSLTHQQRFDFKPTGVQLSRAGMELLSIVDVEEDLTYTKALTEYFDRCGFTLVNVAKPNMVND